MTTLDFDEEQCPDILRGHLKYVYDDALLPYSCTLNLSDLVTNCNKSFTMHLLTRDNEAYFIYTRSGRVGHGGNLSIDCYLDKTAAIIDFESIFRDRTGLFWADRIDKYVHIKGKYHYVATKFAVKDQNNTVVPEVQLPDTLAYLMRLIFDSNAYNRYAEEHRIDQQKLPLGALSKAQIQFASDILQKIKINIRSGGDKKELMDLNSQFYSSIPTSNGNRALTLIDTEASVSERQQVLEDLYYISYLGKSQYKDAYSQYMSLKTELKPVNDPDIIREINDYMEANKGSTHTIKFRLNKLYEINKPDEIRRFKQFENLHNRQLLWHGTRIENIAGILSSCFMLNPNAHITAKMFGNGIYFADSSSKSANYVVTNNDGIGFMILCEVALGNPHKNVDSYFYTEAPDGFHSVMGTGQWTPDTESHIIKDDGLIIPIGKLKRTDPNNTLLYNEYIVYNTAQIRMKYLVEIKI